MSIQQPESTLEPAGLQDVLGVRFDAHDLLVEALTHRSYAFEVGGVEHNERLEFLGDAVLGLIITDMIFEAFPDLSEGELAKIRAATVNSAVLADMAVKVDLGSYMRLGKGEQLSGGPEKPSILADAYEAVLGAVYLDQGMDAARELIREMFQDHIRERYERGEVRDFKTSLQEEATRRTGRLPTYKVTSSGPDHNKRFRAKVLIGGEEMGDGEGRSKKEAEQSAAEVVLKRWTDGA